MIDFDIYNPKLWRPLFDKDYLKKNPQMASLTTYQPTLEYHSIESNREDLEKIIYKYVSSNFEKLRLGINNDRSKKRTTNWNITIGKELASMLCECEMYMMQARHGATNSTLRGN
jgi:hypothetical protein